MKSHHVAYCCSAGTFVVALALAVAAEPACQSPAQVETGLFTTEEIACIVDGLLVDVLAGTPEQIAAGIQSVCKGVGRLGSSSVTPALVTFVQTWQTAEPSERMRWSTFVAEQKGTRAAAPATTK